MTYTELRTATNEFAGSSIASVSAPVSGCSCCCLGSLELYVAVLGTVEAPRVVCPLFSAFGPEPIRQRHGARATARVLVTTPALYRRKVAAIRRPLPDLQHVLAHRRRVAGAAPGPCDAAAGRRPTRYDDRADRPRGPGAAALHQRHDRHAEGRRPRPRCGRRPPRHRRLGLDLHPDDVFWCTADPGWVTGTSYGIIAPLTYGVTSIVDEGDFDAERWYRILAERAGDRLVHRADGHPHADAGRAPISPHEHDLAPLRFVASVGEPLNPEAVVWGAEALGLPFHDNWWQTETGGIMIANHPGMPTPARAHGPAAAGHRGGDPRLRRRGDSCDRTVHVRVSRPGRGRACSPSGRAGPRCSAATCDDDERYRECFAGGWYLTGDLVRRDADGYLWFVGRADDVIKTAGHLIGPFEVESALMEHPAVADAGVYGMPDPVAGDVVNAVVVLAPGSSPADDARRELMAHARRRLGAAVAPREIASWPRCPRPAAARSCAACCGPASSGCPRATSPPWSRPDGAGPHDRRDGALLRRDDAPSAASRSAAPGSTSAGQIRGFLHLYVGEEAVAAGVLDALEPDDTVVATYREHGHALARGVPAGAVMAEMFGKVEGCCGGRGGSMHLFDAARRFYGGNAIVGGGLPIAVGLALADTPPGRRRVTACFFGEGAVAEGEFHECINLAALWQLPVLFCCENNLYAMGTALDRSEADTDLALQGGELRDGRVGRGRHGRRGGRGGRAPRGARGPRRRRALLPGAADLSLPSPLDVRPRALPGQGRGRALEGARPDPSSRRGCGPPASSTTTAWRRWRRRSPPRSTRPSPSPRPAPSNRVDDLTRHVYAEVAP